MMIQKYYSDTASEVSVFCGQLGPTVTTKETGSSSSNWGHVYMDGMNDMIIIIVVSAAATVCQNHNHQQQQLC